MSDLYGHYDRSLYGHYDRPSQVTLPFKFGFTKVQKVRKQRDRVNRIRYYSMMMTDNF